MGRDAAGGISAPTGLTTVNNSGDPSLPFNQNGALGFSRASGVNSTNTVNFTAAANAVDVIVCRNGLIAGIVPATDGQFIDEGQLTFVSPDFPLCTTAASTPAPLIATVTAVNGTALTLSAPASNTVTSGTINHDDGAALQALFNAGCGNELYMLIPMGTYNIHNTLNCMNGGSGRATFLQGQGGTGRVGLEGGSFISYWGPAGGGVSNSLGSAIGALVVSGGVGYTNGPVTLTVTGGTCPTPIQLNATATAGAITSVNSVVNPGVCTALPLNSAVNTSGGGGAGAILNVLYNTGSVLLANGLNGSTFQDIMLYGNYIPKYIFHQPNNGPASSGAYFNRLSFWRPNTSINSAIIEYGPSCTAQLSEQFFFQVFLFQDVGTKFGFNSPCGGNQKNMMWESFSVIGVHFGFTGTSGNWTFTNGIMGSIEEFLWNGTGTLMVNGVESESRWNSGIINVTATAGALVSINALQFLTPGPANGVFAAVTSGPPITITNSFLCAAGVYMGECRWNGNFTSPTVPFVSINNSWENSTTLPTYVGGNRYGGPPNFPNNVPRVFFPLATNSVGDYGAGLVAGVTTITRFGNQNLNGGLQLMDFNYTRQTLGNSAAVPSNFLDIYGGGLQSHNWANPAAPTLAPSPAGANTCTYQIAFRDASGGHTTALSPVATTNTCTTPLSTTNKVTVASPIIPPGTWFMDVIDASNGMLIGTSAANVVPVGNTGGLGIGGQNMSFIDIGQTRTAYSPPSATNNTGQIKADGGLISTPTTFGALPACNAAQQGARFFITDQNTAVAYHGAVTGGGTGKQSVICDGGAYYQN
jgi:hypothetical protein